MRKPGTEQEQGRSNQDGNECGLCGGQDGYFSPRVLNVTLQFVTEQAGNQALPWWELTIRSSLSCSLQGKNRLIRMT